MKLRLWLSLVLLLMSMSAWSQTDEVDILEEEGSYEELKSIMQNTGNQFIYAFFGKNMLLYFLEESDEIALVSEASNEQLTQMSKPFNAVVGQLFVIGMSAVYYLVVIYFVIKFSWYLFQEWWILQSKGESRSSGNERRGMIIKLLFFGGLALAPLPIESTIGDKTYHTNPLTAVFFHLLGETTRFSDEATSELVRSQRQTLTTLPLPAADAKQDSAMAMNLFFSCLRMQEYRENEGEYTETLNVYEQPNTSGQVWRGRAEIGDCGLDVKLGIDNSTDDDIQSLNLNSSDFNFEDGMFVNAQKSVLENVLKDQIARAYAVSKELVKEDEYSDMTEGNPLLLDFTAKEMGNDELARWSEDCPEIESWTSGKDSILIKDRVLLNQLSARCASFALTRAIVYPDTYSVLDQYLSSPSNQRKQIAMCVDEASVDAIMTGTFVSDYKLFNTSVSSERIESIALDACVLSLCSDSNLASGGMYACANAVDMYSTRYRDFKIADRGSIMLGFYMFNLFLHHPPSDVAKNVFNQLQFTFYDEPDGGINESGELELSIEFTVPEVTGRFQDMEHILNDMTDPLLEKDIPTISSVNEFGSVAQIVGFSRLLTCVQSPLQVKNGYVCNNVPQEFSRFGMEMIKGVVAFKTALVMGDSISRTGRYFSIGGKNKGSLEDMATTGVNSVVRKLGDFVLPVTAAGTVAALSELGDNIGFSVTDEFGNLNSSFWGDLAATVGVDAMFLAGMLGTDSALMSFIDGALLVGLLIGIVFGIILPLYPMVLVLSAMSKLLYLISKTLIMHGFKMVDAIFDADTSFMNQKTDTLWADWLAALLKLPLTTIGVILAWLMSNVIISKVLGSMSFAFETNDGPANGIIDTVVMITMALAVVAIIYNMILTVIESFYDFTVEWILGQMTNTPFGDQKAVGWKDAKGILTMMGR
jgi:hypothetical protein